jgi:NDP-sugar pyrophosphorylase family protein
MKAMLLAAGEGMRLRPLTQQIPKCMIPIGGKPILEHTLTWLSRYGITEVIVNLHHLPDLVMERLGDGSKWGLRIAYSIEARLLGTAGGVKKVAAFFDEPFLVWYGDNLSRCNLHRLHQFHLATGAMATIAVHYREEVAHSGIVKLDERDRVVRFLEKPEPSEVFSRWVSAGIFIVQPDVLRVISEGCVADFGRDIFPALLTAGNELCGYRLSPDEGLWWIDQPEDLARVQKEWEEKA